MKDKTYYLTCAAIFFILALLHAARIAFNWDAIVDGFSIPMWTSWASIVICGYLAARGYRAGTKPKRRSR